MLGRHPAKKNMIQIQKDFNVESVFIQAYFVDLLKRFISIKERKKYRELICYLDIWLAFKLSLFPRAHFALFLSFLNSAGYSLILCLSIFTYSFIFSQSFYVYISISACSQRCTYLGLIHINNYLSLLISITIHTYLGLHIDLAQSLHIDLSFLKSLISFHFYLPIYLS